MKEEYFMKKAIAVAKQGVDRGQSPFGAVIIKNGKQKATIVAACHNVVWKNCDATAHAEVTAISQACKKLHSIDLSNCTIYSTTEPCPMCFSAIHWARIAKIVYGASIEDAEKAGFNELHVHDIVLKKLGKDKVKIKTGVLKRENVALFQYWMKKHGKVY
ncbi:MAG: nucleoside deaminase [Candidatus Micrarchaeota archaeon]